MITPHPDRFAWHKSSYSGGSGGQCVEVGSMPWSVGVRDTKNRDLGHLAVPPAVWHTFVSALRRGGAPHPDRSQPHR